MKILISIFFLLFFTINADFVDTSLILKVEEKYGKFAKNRFIALNTMLEKSKNSDLRTKLEKINDFFNDIKYASDQTVYGTSDYWANPYEFLAKDKGDCEDYAIAKYLALEYLGVPTSKISPTFKFSLANLEKCPFLTDLIAIRNSPLSGDEQIE